MQVVVASKFDNRLKEFAERWEVDRYLAATGYLHANIKPFFVALPKVQQQLPTHSFPYCKGRTRQRWPALGNYLPRSHCAATC